MVLQINNNTAISRAQNRLNNEALIKKDLSKVVETPISYPNLSYSIIIGFNIETNQFEQLKQNLNGIASGALSWQYTLITQFNAIPTVEKFKENILEHIKITSGAILDTSDNIITAQMLANAKLSMCDLDIQRIINMATNVSSFGGYRNFFEQHVAFNDQYRNAFFQFIINKHADTMSNFIDCMSDFQEWYDDSKTDEIYADIFKKYIPESNSDKDLEKLFQMITDMPFLDSEAFFTEYLKLNLPNLSSINYYNFMDYEDLIGKKWDLGSNSELGISLNKDLANIKKISQDNNNYTNIKEILQDNNNYTTRNFVIDRFDIDILDTATVRRGRDFSNGVFNFSFDNLKSIFEQQNLNFSITQEVKDSLDKLIEFYNQKTTIKSILENQFSNQINNKSIHDSGEYRIKQLLELIKELPVYQKNKNKTYLETDFSKYVPTEFPF